MQTKLIAGAMCALLALPAGAGAAKKIYAGTTDGSGQIAIDVVVNRKGKPKGISEVRGKNVPVTCDQSGAQTVYFTFPTATKVSKRKFFAEWSQPTYGNESWIRGTFGPKKVINGTLRFDQHFLAEGTFPEENCRSEDLSYRAERGAPDVIPGPVRPAGGGLAAGV